MCQDVAFIGAKDVVICHQNVRCEMKFRVQQISQGEDELILRYRQMNSEVKEILTFMERRERKLAGKIDGETVFFCRRKSFISRRWMRKPLPIPQNG